MAARQGPARRPRFQAGDTVWVPDAARGFRAAVVQEILAGGVLRLAGPGSQQVDVAMAHPHCAEGAEATADCVAMEHLNEASLLENVCQRYARDEIYTHVAHVLLAVNPLRELPHLYGRAAMEPYLAKPRPGSRPPPHPYALAEAALRGARRGQAQAIVISGESGAGKTETAKIVLRYLDVSAAGKRRQHEGDGREQGALAKVLAMGRVLESFGNACTSRNDNSSRFGKYLRLRLETGGIHAQATTYLLEAGRVANRSPGERSFHVFYELMEGLGGEGRRRLGLSAPGAEGHVLLGAEGPPSGCARRDAEGFRALLSALRDLGLDQESGEIFDVLAGVLHLGDALRSRERCAEGAVEFEEESLRAAAGLLGMDADELRRKLRARRVAVRGRRSFCEADRTRAQAETLLRSLVVTIYGRLFTRLVGRMNEALAAGQGAGKLPSGVAEIGLLDIYGFESLGRNSLDQLLINLTNERLQRFFVERVLATEQRAYLQEGLPFQAVEVDDRAAVLGVLGSGLSLLDDLSQQRWRGLPVTDARFCEGLLRCSPPGQGARVVRPARQARGAPQSAGAFVVSHYAGEVEYVAEGWLDRNDAQPFPEVEDLLVDAAKPAVRALAAAAEPKDAAASTLRRQSICRQHQQSLDSLLATLSASSLHFVRCFRPSAEMRAGRLDRPYLLEQLRTCGTVQLLQVMHQGYPHRLAIGEVASRLLPLLGPRLPKALRCASHRTIIKSVMLAYGVPQGQWTLGVTQLFLKAGQLAVLEDLRRDGQLPDPDAVARAVHTVVRGRWRQAVAAISFALWLQKRAELRRVAQRAERRRKLRAVFLASLFLVRAAKAARTARAARAAAMARATAEAARAAAQARASAEAARVEAAERRRMEEVAAAAHAAQRRAPSRRSAELRAKFRAAAWAAVAVARLRRLVAKRFRAGPVADARPTTARHAADPVPDLAPRVLEFGGAVGGPGGRGQPQPWAPTKKRGSCMSTPRKIASPVRATMSSRQGAQAAAASGGQPSLPSRPHHGQLEALQPLQPEKRPSPGGLATAAVRGGLLGRGLERPTKQRRL